MVGVSRVASGRAATRAMSERREVKIAEACILKACWDFLFFCFIVANRRAI
jgi:hypothetical protein